MAQLVAQLWYNAGMSFQPRYVLTQRLRDNLREIERLKGQVCTTMIAPSAEMAVRLRASVEAVHSSTAIEGNPLDLRQVREVITTGKHLTRDEYAVIEVSNYKKAWDYIQQRRLREDELTVSDILDLHRLITSGLLDETRCGCVRQIPVVIENSQRQVLYQAVEAERVSTELEQLIDWVRQSQFNVHPVVVAGVIHLQLLNIHPFADGNGRTARATTALYLALQGYDNDGGLVLDTYYASDRAAYYRMLQEVSGRDYNCACAADWTAWLEYFVSGVVSSLHVLAAEMKIAGMLTDRQSSLWDRIDQEIVSAIVKWGRVTISQLETLLPEVSRRSLQRRLQDLVQAGFLRKVGETKDVYYVQEEGA